MANGKDMSYGTGRSGKIVEIDLEHYQAMLDDPAMTEEHKRQVIEALWSIIVSFVELGYGVHPVQQACGKLTKNEDDCGAEQTVDVECEDYSP